MDKNAIPEEKKELKLSLGKGAHIFAKGRVESKLLINLNVKVPEDSLPITDFTPHFR